MIFKPEPLVVNEKSASEEHKNIKQNISDSDILAGVTKNSEGKLKHIVFSEEPTESDLDALESAYEVSWVRVDG